MDLQRLTHERRSDPSTLLIRRDGDRSKTVPVCQHPASITDRHGRDGDVTHEGAAALRNQRQSHAPRSAQRTNDKLFGVTRMRSIAKRRRDDAVDCKGVARCFTAYGDSHCPMPVMRPERLAAILTGIADAGCNIVWIAPLWSPNRLMWP